MTTKRAFALGFLSGLLAVPAGLLAAVLVDEWTRRQSARSWQEWHGRMYQ